MKNKEMKKKQTIKKWMQLQTVDKDIFKVMTLPNNLVVICSLYMCFLLKHGSQKLQTKS